MCHVRTQDELFQWSPARSNWEFVYFAGYRADKAEIENISCKSVDEAMHLSYTEHTPTECGAEYQHAGSWRLFSQGGKTPVGSSFTVATVYMGKNKR